MSDMEDWKLKLHKGDQVYWTDPDNDLCSGYRTFLEYAHEEGVVILGDEWGGITEALLEEIS